VETDDNMRSNEVSLVLVKGKEDVTDSLSHIQMGQLALVITKENGFNFLEEFSHLQANEHLLNLNKKNPFKFYNKFYQR
jgi:hypothetical protein